MGFSQNLPQQGREKQKRSRNKRGSLEQDTKKRTVDVESDTHISSIVTHDDTHNIGMSESDSSLSDASHNTSHISHVTGKPRLTTQKPLNSTRGGLVPPQINKNGRGVDPYITRTQPHKKL